MLEALTILLVCQLVGETIVQLAGIPVPGPVLGMVLLLAGLMLRGRLRRTETPPEALGKTADGLLQHLSLLFVPAGVGVMLHLPLIAREWPAIVTALIGSTILTIIVTALVMRLLVRSGGQDTPTEPGP